MRHNLPRGRRNARGERWPASIVISAARTIIPLARIGWKAAFAWWLVPLFYWKRRREFTAEIRETLSFLFVERAGIVKSPRPGHPVLGEVAIAADGLVFYFSPLANPSESGVDALVAPQHAPRDSQHLTFALMAVDPAVPIESRLWSSLAVISMYLRPRFDSLKQAFSREQFEATKQRVRNLAIHENATRI
jgi:hypothetical protein